MEIEVHRSILSEQRVEIFVRQRVRVAPFHSKNHQVSDVDHPDAESWEVFAE